MGDAARPWDVRPIFRDASRPPEPFGRRHDERQAAAGRRGLCVFKIFILTPGRSCVHNADKVVDAYFSLAFVSPKAITDRPKTLWKKLVVHVIWILGRRRKEQANGSGALG